MKNADKIKLLIELELTISTCEICQGKIIFDGNGDLVINKCTCENPIKEVNKMAKLYWYEYKFRGFSPGCQPNDLVEWDDEYGRFGAVAYKRELTPKELEDYELRPIEK